MLENFTYTDIAVGAVATLLVARILTNRRSQPLPPGPPTTPFFGHALQVPKDKPWITFAAWAKEYGDILGVRIFGRTVILLSSLTAANELFEKRGGIYSDRPTRVMAELSGYGPTLLLKKYDKSVRDGRKLLHGQLNPRAVQSHHALQEHHATQFVISNLEKPENFIKGARLLATSVILTIAYGYKVTGEDDPLMGLAEKVMLDLSKCVTPNYYLVDALPFLRYLPSWFPGADFHRTAKESADTLHRFINEPFDDVVKQVAAGTAPPCYVANILQELGDKVDEDTLENLKWTAGDMYGAGSDTTISTICTFFLAMTLNPHVQRKAHAELEAIVGNGRLPSYSDRSSLPYIEAIVKEIFRWRPAVPFAGHSLREDDEYRGFVIPANTLVSVNAWALTHDETMYPDPETYNPDRFLPEKGEPPLDARQLVFGFGRRSCPGLHLAGNLVWIVVARTLATSWILPELDANGNEILPSVEYTSGAISHPKPFKCRIIPRADGSVAQL